MTESDAHIKLLRNIASFLNCKRKIFFLLILLPTISIAQSGMWTWIKGSETLNYSGHFGTMGIADPLNNPPALYEAGHWTDLEGNFWLFGGVNFLNGNEISSAMWKYNPETNIWTWMKGPSIPNQPGIYGVQGVSSPSNNPGARAWGMLTWTDFYGNLWLYAGGGLDAVGWLSYLADLWRYNIATNEWTFMGGVTSTYGLGPSFDYFQVFDPINSPGTINESQAFWTDSDGNFWLFGGQIDGDHCYNYVWEYDVGINQWAWMAGSEFANVPNSYGTQGQFGNNTYPGARRGYGGFKDQDGNFWLIGGNNYRNYFGGGSYADLWEFSTDLLMWAWQGGSSILDDPGNIGAECDTSVNYYPSARLENTMRWVDACGNFWMYGGMQNWGDEFNLFADLWIYSPETEAWSFVSGNTQPGLLPASYGTKGIPDPGNQPGGRFGGASWQDEKGRFYLFGGKGWLTYGDLWRYEADTLCPEALACIPPVFSASDKNICEKFCINFLDQSTNNPITWQWHFPGGIPSFSSDQNPVNICYNNPGNYDVTLITYGISGSDTTIYEGLIKVYPTPDPPIISKAGDILTCSNSFAYQWQFNVVDIPGATNQTYIANQDGYYTVSAYDEQGCYNSTTIYVAVTGIAEIANETGVFVYPNPNNGLFHLALNLHSANIAVSIYSVDGLRVYQKIIENKQTEQTYLINLSNFPPGYYMLEIKAETILTHQKIVIKPNKH